MQRLRRRLALFPSLNPIVPLSLARACREQWWVNDPGVCKGCAQILRGITKQACGILTSPGTVRSPTRAINRIRLGAIAYWTRGDGVRGTSTEMRIAIQPCGICARAYGSIAAEAPSAGGRGVWCRAVLHVAGRGRAKRSAQAVPVVVSRIMVSARILIQ